MNYNFYLIDDDPSVTAILSRIIVNANLGDVVGVNHTGNDAVSDIMSLPVDIVIIDLLLPAIDGISLARQIRNAYATLPLVMISEVQAKDMIAQAYQAGVEFYINKPINVKEVSSVIKRVDEKLQMKRVIANFQRAFDSIKQLDSPMPVQTIIQFTTRARAVLNQLGMHGESGTRDILMIGEYLAGVHDGVVKRAVDYRMIDLYQVVVDNARASGELVMARSVEQRVRRAIAQGMHNLALMGIEDVNHDTFYRYAHHLFDYAEVRHEMNYLTDRRKQRGKTTIKRFISGLVQVAQTVDNQ